MEPTFAQEKVEQILIKLDDTANLFPQFGLKKVNNELQLLGSGGFSFVYEMYNKERPELSFAMKVIGLQRHTVTSEEFWNTGRIQWILCQECQYIMRVLDARELLVSFDETGNIEEVKDAAKQVWEEGESCLHLQIVLMEKLDKLLQKDRFGKVQLLREELNNEKEVLKFALEIGQALAGAHNNKCLHRDVKLENIFWDQTAQVYKLGDFGIAKWAEDGNAETIVYTDGYGAPEIERRLYDCYNATADIYSFGITLYLLLNDLRFPGSDGYYSKVEVQYHPEFVFPAPVHASEKMTRVIRKMCSYYPKDRYQSMNEALIELTSVLDSLQNAAEDEELLELADMVTETYREEKTDAEDVREPEKRPKTRAERKEEQKVIDEIYRDDSLKYLLVLTILMTLLFKGIQSDGSMVTNWMFYVLPGAVLFEALLQRVKEFHLFFGAIVVVFSVFSVYTLGLTVPHIVLILCVLIGCPVLSLAGAFSTGLWMLFEISNQLQFLDYLYQWDLGWILLIAVMLTVNRYFRMGTIWKKITTERAFWVNFIYDKIFIVMFIAGLVLFVLQKCNGMNLPILIERMHLIRTGLIGFLGIMVCFRWDRLEDRYIKIGEEVTVDDNFLDK
ncbi:MAG: protein kinase [Lachnospiraceae bacterium]